MLLGSVLWGHLARGLHLSAWVLGLAGFPVLLVGLQWLRTRRTATRLEATGPVGHTLNLAVFLVLYLLEPTSDAALIFYGASMWLAALRGYAGCEVLPVSNWLLARFPGSPTVRVDGRDVEPGSEPAAESIVACRLYRLGHRFAGQPEERWVREALLRAAGRS